MASRVAKPLIIPDEKGLDLFVVLDALTDQTRREILRKVVDEPGIACGELALSVTASTATQHFRVLRESGLIEQKIDGTRHRNWLRRNELDRRFPGLMDLVLAHMPSSNDI
jgi:DNA-binding transcriptional ArsR family regulator